MPIQMHERVMPTQRLHNELQRAVLDVLAKHRDCTILELLHCLNQIMQGWITSGLRDERHPNDPDKRAGEA